MDTVTVLYPVACFGLAAVFFSFAIQQPLHHPLRHVLGVLHAFSGAIVFLADSQALVLYPHISIPLFLGLTMHTTSILFVDKQVQDLRMECCSYRLRAIFRIWSNVRRVQFLDDTVKITVRERMRFAGGQGARVLLLWLAYRRTSTLLSSALRAMSVRITDFAPIKYGLLPSLPLTRREVVLRALMSVQWIWASYVNLSLAHGLLAIFFVFVIQCDHPLDWPPLFGSIKEAYSLRRFWGTFWQRLHVHPFASYTPSVLCHGKSSFRKAMRSLWMFLLSAVCHGIADWVLLRRNTMTQELHFFLSNYVICLVETVARRTAMSKSLLDDGGGILVRVLGYLWVFSVFFCIVPAWQYPFIYRDTA